MPEVTLRDFQIQSHKGPYTVHFTSEAFANLRDVPKTGIHFLVDDRVASLYENELREVLQAPSVLRIEANEENKALDRFTAYAEHLVSRGVRRTHTLVAIGGGILQDITCFLASTLLRGIEWEFYPTTLLAQADSCIGSKSSINVGKIKNLIGTFNPPRQISISTTVLHTLSEVDARSGVGEMIKAHIIDGPSSFNDLAADYERIFSSRQVMEHYILRSLEIKKGLIEQDEFDRGVRNVMNYGHSFGHAIESATDFMVPHGIAVTIGMDLANYVAVWYGRMDRIHLDRMRPTLLTNAHNFLDVDIPIEDFFRALRRDKKNVGSSLQVILPNASVRIEKVDMAEDDTFRMVCQEYFDEVRHR